ncbi:uncharacterized protein MONOS_17956 [Monocercomonoides exilis]|uniref:uncharacterized protein n=1 Tax=Monocercomonoides exilis TaxID=2049356 RepID=UPI00355A2050|nr:hypothetical protein MONOS_17956 [Monocercomonoides exilis]
MALKQQFSQIFSELKHCEEVEQRQKIEKLREFINAVNERELRSEFAARLFDTIEKMITEENEKKEEENVNLMIDLCECRLILNDYLNNLSKEVASICLPFFLKFTSKRIVMKMHEKKWKLLNGFESHWEI